MHPIGVDRMKRVPAVFWVFALLTMWAAVPVGAQSLERPRETDYTDDAEDALEDAEDARDDAERLGHFQTALTNAEAEIAANPNNPLGYRLGALAALGLGQYAVAGQYFDRATELYPLYELEDVALREQTWIDLYQEASPLISEGDYEGAAAIFENANAIYQGRPEVMITLAQIYASINELDRAIESIDQVSAFLSSEVATSADPEMLAGWQEQASTLPLLKAQVLMAAGRLPEAVEAYRELTASDPSNLGYKLDLAAVLMELGNVSESVAVYEDILSTPGLTGPDYYRVGVGFYQAEDFASAARGFSEAANQNARDRDAVEMWARSLQLDSLWAEIPAVAQRWVELDPYSQSGWAILAQAANANGDAETTQQAMNAIQGLEVSVDQLELQRFGDGGGVVGGSLVNKTLEAGASVTLVFTFYGTAGDSLGTASATVSLGEPDTAQFFEVEFDSTETVGGYSYELTVG
jgi:tetratricopeptide (TPR) repeat protein